MLLSGSPWTMRVPWSWGQAVPRPMRNMPSVGLSPEEGGWGPSGDRAEVCGSWREQVTLMLVFLEGRGHCDLPTVPEGRHSKTRSVCQCPSHLPKPKHPCLLKAVEGLFGEISHLYLDPT